MERCCWSWEDSRTQGRADTILFDVTVGNILVPGINAIKKESAYAGKVLNIFARVWTGRYFTGHLTTSTNKLFAESCYKLHKVTYAVPRIKPPSTNPHDNFHVRRKSTKSVTRKVNWERYGFSLAYKLSLPESNQHDILPISLPRISSVIS